MLCYNVPNGSLNSDERLSLGLLSCKIQFFCQVRSENKKELICQQEGVRTEQLLFLAISKEPSLQSIKVTLIGVTQHECESSWADRTTADTTVL